VQHGKERKAEAEAKLKKRGNDEAESMRGVLEDHKRGVLSELGRYDQTQLLLSLDLEKRQLESNRRYWDKWLTNVEGDLKSEPGHSASNLSASLTSSRFPDRTSALHL